MGLMSWLWDPPALTRERIRVAYAIAVVTDVAQFMLGPLGWGFGDEILDLIAMALMWRTVGFHPLLLPTFALELVPVADMLPTWTGCVALVIASRKKHQVSSPDTVPPGSVIDVEAKRVE